MSQSIHPKSVKQVKLNHLYQLRYYESFEARDDPRLPEYFYPTVQSYWVRGGYRGLVLIRDNRHWMFRHTASLLFIQELGKQIRIGKNSRSLIERIRVEQLLNKL